MRRPLSLTAACACALVLGACGTTTSTTQFKGAEKEVAQTISDLQSHVTGGEQKKICSEDLSAEVVQRLGGQKACEAVVKEQVNEIDSTELDVESVKVDGENATATVKSVYGGKKRLRTLTLKKEGDRWRIAALSEQEAAQ
jgi:hypothetical protein